MKNKEEIYNHFKPLFNLKPISEKEKADWKYTVKLNYSFREFLIGEKIIFNDQEYLVVDCVYNKKTVSIITDDGKRIRPSYCFMNFLNPIYNKYQKISLHPGKDIATLLSKGCLINRNHFKSIYYKTEEYQNTLKASINDNNSEEIKRLGLENVKSGMQLPSVKKKVMSTMKERHGCNWFTERGKHYHQSITKKIWEKYGEDSFDFIGISKLEIEVVSTLLKHEKTKDLFSDDLYFFSEENEQFVFEKTDGKFFSVDFFDKENNIVIEVNGDFIHAKPDKYPDEYENWKKGLTAKQIREKDKKRNLFLEKEFGAKVLIIWQSDWKKNKESEIERIRKEILNENN